eukprot:GFUD01021335.1.p1 GENE.GFUD01021335.1~~GFUD01021335.1.p1  ORF type:complete len:1268 (-),score=248.81 GFUD01021335.1:181-3984(-)
MSTFPLLIFTFLFFSYNVYSVDVVKKTTKSVKETAKEDDDVYYQYKVENIPIHWERYWIESKSSIPFPAGRSNVSVELPFSFNFYAHPVSKIFIFPSGYISTSIEKEEHSTKYIAPMKANLDPYHDESSGLSYWIDKRNSSISVEWRNAIAKDLAIRIPFTFRVKIWSSGLIEFTYQNLGFDLAHLLPFDKDFRIGIGDSVKSFGMVFNYHSVDIPRDMIKDKTKVTLRPLPTCTTRTSCDECVQANLNFHCFWCPSIKKCLSGIDFHRAEYVNENCPKADSKSVCKPKPAFIQEEMAEISTSKPSLLENLKEITRLSSSSIGTTELPSVLEDLKDITSLLSSSMGTTELPIPPGIDQHHLYYNATLLLDEEVAKNLWVNMDDTTSGRLRTNSASVSKNQAHMFKLPFPFSFFGNIKNQISFTGDGFISTMSSWMIHDKTHFIAPLKGLFGHKFKTMTTSVNYKATSQSLTVQWSTTKYYNVKNQVPFVFQTTLHSNGDIDFVYKNLGKMQNSDKEFIGLSEGFSEEMRLGFLLMPKSNPIKYYESHNVNLTDMKVHLTNWTAIQIKALPTCSDQKNCGDCLSMSEVSGFNCGWCSTADLCRDSKEDPGENWVVRNCYYNMVHQEEQCPKETVKPLTYHDFEDLKPDDHKYYKSVMIKSEDSWARYFKDFSKLNSSLVTDLWKTSNNFLTADPYTLSFVFPFYGHPIKNIMILSGGFISLASSFSNRTLLEHEYIAPLMADLDASYSKQAKIQIYEQEKEVTINWSKMKLISKSELASFSFQLTLMSNGTIILCYQDIPDGSITKILSSDLDFLHPVKIGLSDSFAYDAKKAFTNKTSTALYKYHDLDLKSYAPHIQSRTAIRLDPLPTCNSFSSCSSCLRADPQLNCVWCPGLQFCSDGMDRRHQEWNAKRCYLTTVGLTTVKQCPLEILKLNQKFYNQTMYHQQQSIFGDYDSRYLQNLKLDLIQDPNYFHIEIPFKFPYFEEEVTSMMISTHGVLGISSHGIKNNSSSEPVMYKYIAPFKGILKFDNEGTIHHGEVEINGGKCYGIKWANAKFSKDESISFQCGLCKDGTIYFHYTKIDPYAILELDNLGINIGLWHGVITEEFVDMAAEEVDISKIKANLTLSRLVIKFSPLTHCSLSSSCLSTPECQHYISTHNCSRFTCQEPSEPSGFCPKHEESHAHSVHHKSAGEGVAVLGVVGGVLLVVLIAGVLVYGVKRMDSRPGQWQTIHSIFLPGYHIFRSGTDIGSTDTLTEEGRRAENEIHL